MKKFLLIVVLIFLIFSVGTVSAQQLLDMRIPSARVSAIGGRHAALTDDFSTIFSNPAGFQSAKSELSVAELTFGLSGPIFDIAGVVVEGAAEGDIASLLTSPNVQDLMSGLYASMNLLGPVSFGYVGKGLGFGIFTTSNVTFVNSKPLTITSNISERLTLAGGYSFGIPFAEGSKHSLDFGVLLKGMLEGQVEIEKSFLEFPDLFSSFSLDTITGQPFYFISSIGFDLGVKYSWNDTLHVGITGIDVFSPSLIQSYSTLNAFLDGSEEPAPSNDLYPIKINTGIMYTPNLGRLNKYISDLKLMLDYDDIFDFLLHPGSARHPILHIGAGLEVELLQILSIRMGMYEGLFTAGVGLDLKIFTLNAAMFGTELSSEPGLRPVYNILIGLEFRYDKK